MLLDVASGGSGVKWGTGLMHNVCRILVVVDDDIDPSNAEEVFWAIATRTDPESSFEIQRDCPSSPLDTMIPTEKKLQGNLTSGRVLIIACRPWERKDEFPHVNKASDKLRSQIYNKWRFLFDG